MPPRQELDRNALLEGWPGPPEDSRCRIWPMGEWGLSGVEVRLGGKIFRAEFPSAMRSPHAPDVLQLDFASLRSWQDGSPMSPTERRQVAALLLRNAEAQLYGRPEDLQEEPE